MINKLQLFYGTHFHTRKPNIISILQTSNIIKNGIEDNRFFKRFSFPAQYEYARHEYNHSQKNKNPNNYSSLALYCFHNLLYKIIIIKTLHLLIICVKHLFKISLPPEFPVDQHQYPVARLFCTGEIVSDHNGARFVSFFN